MNGNGHHASLNKVASIKVAGPGNASSKLINPPRPLAGVENPIFNLSDAKSEDTTEDMSERETVPDSPSNNSVANGVSNGGVMDGVRNGHLLGNGRIHNIQWPIGSIPRRVKKLSWEDEQTNKVRKC